jgi:hypothetical protein
VAAKEVAGTEVGEMAVAGVVAEERAVVSGEADAAEARMVADPKEVAGMVLVAAAMEGEEAVEAEVAAEWVREEGGQAAVEARAVD